MNNICDLISYYSLLVCSVATRPPSFPVSGHSHMLFPLSKIPFPQPLAWLTLTTVGFYWSYFSATVYANYLKHPSFPLDPTFLLPWPTILEKKYLSCLLFASPDCWFIGVVIFFTPRKCLLLRMCSINVSQVNEWKNQMCRTYFTRFEAPE